jgi:hypothetical protein
MMNLNFKLYYQQAHEMLMCRSFIAELVEALGLMGLKTRLSMHILMFLHSVKDFATLCC